MKITYKVILAKMLILVLASSQAGAEGSAIPAETKERIIEQYRLELLAQTGPSRVGIDFEISGLGETDLFLWLGRFMVNPVGCII
ncbi:hypothetical protein NSU18_01755 [Paenibacillus sp. FSL H8-0048]|uniref:hypothetical protein n=1 Tax=Paenibacillus sp. FSL H8-0048 TaxID=2954508 RepID=UPI0030FBE3F9